MKRACKKTRKDSFQGSVWYYPSDHGILRNHKVERLRMEARSAQLLYAFVRGKKRSNMEGHRRKENDYDIEWLVFKKAKSHYREINLDELKEWLKAC